MSMNDLNVGRPAVGVSTAKQTTAAEQAATTQRTRRTTGGTSGDNLIVNRKSVSPQYGANAVAGGGPVLPAPGHANATDLMTVLLSLRQKHTESSIESAEQRIQDRAVDKELKSKEMISKLKKVIEKKKKAGIGSLLGKIFSWIGVGLSFVAAALVGVVSGGAAAAPLLIVATMSAALLIAQQSGLTEKAMDAMGMDDKAKMGFSLGITVLMVAVNIGAVVVSGGASAVGGASQVAQATTKVATTTAETATSVGSAAAQTAAKVSTSVAEAAVEAGAKAATAAVETSAKAVEAAVEGGVKAATAAVETSAKAAEAAVEASVKTATAAVETSAKAAEAAVEGGVKAATAAVETSAKAAEATVEAGVKTATAAVETSAKAAEATVEGSVKATTAAVEVGTKTTGIATKLGLTSNNAVKMADRLRSAVNIAGGVSQMATGGVTIGSATQSYQASSARASSMRDKALLTKMQAQDEEDMRRIRNMIEQLENAQSAVMSTIVKSSEMALQIRQSI